MRAAQVWLLAAALMLGASGSAAGQSRPAPAAQDKAASGAADRWGDGRVESDPSEQPARGQPYRWRQMAFGAVLMAAMLAFVIWLVRRQTRAPR